MRPDKPKTALAAVLDRIEEIVTIDENTIAAEKNIAPSINEIVENSHTLITLDPSICAPWTFANRSENELGDIDALAHSLKMEGQQEPILVRPSKSKSSDIKYEVVFGRRRWEAASKIKLPLLAICKNLTDQEAAIAQKAENENREPVSPYSEAIHYKKLLEKGCFKSEHDLSAKLGIPKSSLYELMAFTKIPEEIMSLIHNPHKISKLIAVKINSLLKADENNFAILRKIAPKIGDSIDTPTKLENQLNILSAKIKTSTLSSENYIYNGTSLFNIQKNKGKTKITFNNSISNILEFDDLLKIIKTFVEDKISNLKDTVENE